MDIGEFEKRMDDALGEVKQLLVQSGYYDNQTLENIDCDRDDPDDVQRWNELTNTSKLLLKAVDDLNYLHRPMPVRAGCTWTPAADTRKISTSTPLALASSFYWRIIAANPAGCVHA